MRLSRLRVRREKNASRDGKDFGWEISHEAVTRRPPIPLDTMVPRIEGYAYDVGVWDLSIIQGPFSIARAKPQRYDSQTFASLYCVVGSRRYGQPCYQQRECARAV